MENSTFKHSEIICLGIMLFLIMLSIKMNAQSKSLVFRGNGSNKAYMVMNGGSQTKPVYLVVNNPNPIAIRRTGTDGGWIISENEFNIVRWNMGSNTGTFVVPFGASTGIATDEYIPLSFTKTSSEASDAKFATFGTGSDNTTYPSDVESMNGIFGGSAINNLIDRYYFIDVANTMTAEMEFSYKGSENATTVDPGNLTSPQQWDNTNKIWLSSIGPGANGVSSGIGAIPSGSTSSFFASKVWALSHNEQPLPIQLISFDAVCNTNQINLSWTTATETNNSLFTVQRSSDANNFEDITSLPGAGNSNIYINYSAIDTHPLSQIAYYRLRQTDYDGNFTFSTIKTIEKCSPDLSESNVYFDATTGSVVVTQTSDDGLPFTVSLQNMLGQQILKEDRLGGGQVRLDIGSLANGVYMVVIRTEREVFSAKVYISR